MVYFKNYFFLLFALFSIDSFAETVINNPIDAGIAGIVDAIVDTGSMGTPPLGGGYACCHFDIPGRGNAYLWLDPTNCGNFGGVSTSSASCQTL